MECEVLIETMATTLWKNQSFCVGGLKARRTVSYDIACRGLGGSVNYFAASCALISAAYWSAFKPVRT